MSETVKVIVRVRPMNKLEKEKNSKEIVQLDEHGNQVVLRKPGEDSFQKSFAYDSVYGQQTAQSTIYQQTVFPLVESVVEGYNGTIFAYGQTGCGKTFTMMGNPQKDQLRGIIPRTFSHIVSIIESAKDRQFLVSCSFIEIYNEQIHDLLGGDIKEKKEIKEDEKGEIYVKGLSKHVVKTVQEMDKWMIIGFKNRAVGQTVMNKDSSRSHSIFTVRVESQFTDENGQRFTAGKLNLVDLAGSERQSKTKAEGERLKEATKINLSLSALGNVISALVDGKSSHIPYRDSKLTRLLQDSLGGNTKTIMIANISPADYNFEETLSTLRYASRAKFIKNKPTVNEDPKDAMLRQYAQEIKRLKMMLEGAPIQSSTAELQHFRDINVDSDLMNEIQKKYSNELQEKEDLLKKQKLQKERIEQMLRSLEQQVVKGGSGTDTAEVKKYKELKQKVKKQRIEKERLIQERKQQEEEMWQMKKSYSNLQQQVDEYRNIIQELRQKLLNAEKEATEMDKENLGDRDELLDTIRDQDKQVKFLTGIVKMLLRDDQLQSLRSQSTWNEDKMDYRIPPFYLKEKKIFLPKLKEHECIDLVEDEKMKKELRFDKSDAAPSVDDEFKMKETTQSVAQRQKKYLNSTKNFDSYEKTYSSNSLNLDAPLKPKPKNIVLTPIMTAYQEHEKKGKKILEPISPGSRKLNGQR